MKHLFVPFVLLWVQMLCAQNEAKVNVLEYEIRRLVPMTQQYIDNTLTIYHRGSEVYAFFEDMQDVNVVPKPLYRVLLPNKWGAFYYDASDGDAVWVRVLAPGDTIRAELTFEPEEWELLPDTATISGFFCRKARRHFNPDFVVEAWYTEDLGFHAMPKEYLGLPGVLVQSSQYGVFRLRSVQLRAREVSDLRPDCGKLVKLRRLLSAKSEAQKLMNVIPWRDE